MVGATVGARGGEGDVCRFRWLLHPPGLTRGVRFSSGPSTFTDSPPSFANLVPLPSVPPLSLLFRTLICSWSFTPPCAMNQTGQAFQPLQQRRLSVTGWLGVFQAPVGTEPLPQLVQSAAALQSRGLWEGKVLVS